MRIVLDTNAYSAAGRGEPKAIHLLKTAEEIFLPFVVLAELRAGFLVGNQGKMNEGKLTEFLLSKRVHVLFPDEQTTHHYARIFRELRTQGTPIPTNDLWIAALCLQHAFLLISSDRHFSDIVGLSVISLQTKPRA